MRLLGSATGKPPLPRVEARCDSGDVHGLSQILLPRLGKVLVQSRVQGLDRLNRVEKCRFSGGSASRAGVGVALKGVPVPPSKFEEGGDLATHIKIAQPVPKVKRGQRLLG